MDISADLMRTVWWRVMEDLGELKEGAGRAGSQAGTAGREAAHTHMHRASCQAHPACFLQRYGAA